MTTKRVLRSLLAALLGLGLVAGLFFLTGISLASLRDLIARVDATAFAGMVLCSLLFVVLGGMKWHFIAHTPAPRRFFYTYYTAQAMLLSQFLPTPMAIAVNRAGVMKFKQNVTLKKGLLNALYDMGFDFGIATILVPVSLLQWYLKFSWDLWLAASLLMAAAACLVLMSIPTLIPRRWLERFGLGVARKDGLLSKRIIGLMMLLSTLRFALVTGRLMLGAVALKVAIPVTAIAFATPVATMSALIMITPANLGVAEWSWSYVLTLWGVPLGVGALYGVSFRILVFAAQLVTSALCWVVYTAAARR